MGDWKNKHCRQGRPGRRYQEAESDQDSQDYNSGTTYRSCYSSRLLERNPEYESTRHVPKNHRDYKSPEERVHSMESKHLRDCSSDGEAPILPMSPEDPEDPKPICDSPENEHKVPTWKSCNNAWCYLILGYLAGILMGLIWYYSNPKKGCRNLNGFWLLAVLFVPIAIILVYKPTARCIAALCIPTMASFQFRVLIIAFALLSAFSGPVENITRNIGILASSLTCDWNLLWKALDQMHLIMAQPSHSVEESFQGTMSELHRIIDKLNIHLVHLEIPFDQIHATYRTTLEWMQLQQDYFHHEMGSPYTRCMGAGLVSIHQCQSKLNNPRVSCPNQKYFACFCEDLQDLGSFFANNLQIQQMIMEDILRRLQLNFAKIRLTFIVTIIFDHNSEKDFYCSTPDKDLEEEINRSWDSYMQKFHFLYFWLYVIIFIILFQVVVRSMEFRFRYLASEDFDNVYITEDFEDYEEQHYQIQGIRALPLSNGEENKYVKISSMRLLPEEFELMKHSGMFLIITGIQLFCICYVDQFLYSFLNLMNYHGQRITTLNRSKKLKVEGSGQIADVLRDLLSAFEPKYSGVDPQACLPVPEKTRNYYYMLILLLYILAWFLVFWEPYGLRQRHRIMAYFYPDEADRRAHHLHFTILHERNALIKANHNRARYLNFYADSSRLINWISWFSLINIWCSTGCRGDFIGRTCTVCQKPLKKLDNFPCKLPSCEGIYCHVCFLESNNSCVLCSFPSDISEIGYSSEDPESDSCKADCADRDKSASL